MSSDGFSVKVRSGRWRCTVVDTGACDEVHVIPEFGPGHTLARTCWCCPMVIPETLDSSRYISTVWVHHVVN